MQKCGPNSTRSSSIFLEKKDKEYSYEKIKNIHMKNKEYYMKNIHIKKIHMNSYEMNEIHSYEILAINSISFKNSHHVGQT